MHLILFDIDGTLVDSNDFDSRLYLEAIHAVLGVRISDDWTQYVHVTDSGVLEEILDRERFGGDRALVRAQVKRAFVDKVAAYLDRHAVSVSEIPGAASFLEVLARRADARIGLATGGWKESALMKLKAIGLNAAGVPLASASDAVSRTAIMELAARRALGGVEPLRRVYFGDAVWDKDASETLGFKFVAIGGAVEHHNAFADYQHIDELLEVLGFAR